MKSGAEITLLRFPV